MKFVSRVAILFAVSTVLSGCPAGDQATGPCTPAANRRYAAPWSELSDEQLYLEVVAACGRVFVGFKEAGAVRGVSPTGQSLTTDATVARMKDYLVDHGFTFEWVASDLPHLSARMPMSRWLVGQVRHNVNVDYLEPIFPMFAE